MSTFRLSNDLGFDKHPWILAESMTNELPWRSVMPLELGTGSPQRARV